MFVLLKYLTGELVPLEVPQRELTRYQLYRLVWEKMHPKVSFQALTLMTEEGEFLPDLSYMLLEPEQMIYVLIQDCYADLTLEYMVEAIYRYHSYDKFVVRIVYMNSDGVPSRVHTLPFYYSGNDEICVDVEVIDYSEYGEIINIESARKLSVVTDVLPAMDEHIRARLERQLLSLWKNYMLI